MYERIALAARVTAPPGITPSQALSTVAPFKVPSRTQIDHLFLTELGLANGAVVNPKSLWVEVWDNHRNRWQVNPVPIECLNNSVRSRQESRQYGAFVDQVLAPGAAYVVPVGEHVLIANGANLVLQWQTPLGWGATAPPAGAVMGDGVNVRVLNTAVAPPNQNVYVQRIDQYGAGEWWLPKPFRLEKQHSMNVSVWNRMAVATRFILTFQCVGEQTKKTFVLDQDIALAAGATAVFGGIGFSIESEEAMLLKAMSYSPHPEAAGFDPRLIEMIVQPSVGGKWASSNNDHVPLLAYTNIRGDYVEAFHVPTHKTVFEQNDYLQARFWNYAPGARTVLMVLAGHTIEEEGDVV